MNNVKYILSLILNIFAFALYANSFEYSIIPRPTTIKYSSNNELIIPKEVTISDGFTEAQRLILSDILSQSGRKSKIAPNNKALIKIKIDNKLKSEAYNLFVTDKDIIINYSDELGQMWAVQTLRQILYCLIDYPKLTAVNITDTPKYSWRGFHLDVSRHMFTLNYLHKLVDQLSNYKINKLHLHLTDDQGWRIEIKKFPSLAKLGGYRKLDKFDKECIDLSKTDKDFVIDPRFIKNDSIYGGYYTQEEIAELISYAKNREIEIIPEIDMPGHFQAAINLYPQLSCKGHAIWGEEFSYPLCPSNMKIYEFLYSIIDEIAALFPSKYFHIGCDEVDKTPWKECDRCKSFMKSQNIDSVHGLESYFVKKISDYVRKKGKVVLAWDDSYNKDNGKDIIYGYWRDWQPKQPTKITQNGNKLIFMDWTTFYLGGGAPGKYTRKLYDFSFGPQFKGLNKDNLIGFQTCLWTETTPTERVFERRVFPSLQAFSERVWGNEGNNWDNFKKRMQMHFRLLDSNNIIYSSIK